jgi:hypothetical protein
MQINFNKDLDDTFWTRGLFVVLFFVIAYIVRVLILITAILQIISHLFWKKANENLSLFGNNISLYFYEIMQFITYNTDKKPFPFSPWPRY